MSYNSDGMWHEKRDYQEAENEVGKVKAPTSVIDISPIRNIENLSTISIPIDYTKLNYKGTYTKIGELPAELLDDDKPKSKTTEK